MSCRCIRSAPSTAWRPTRRPPTAAPTERHEIRTSATVSSHTQPTRSWSRIRPGAEEWPRRLVFRDCFRSRRRVPTPYSTTSSATRMQKTHAHTAAVTVGAMDGAATTPDAATSDWYACAAHPSAEAPSIMPASSSSAATTASTGAQCGPSGAARQPMKRTYRTKHAREMIVPSSITADAMSNRSSGRCTVRLVVHRSLPTAYTSRSVSSALERSAAARSARNRSLLGEKSTDEVTYWSTVMLDPAVASAAPMAEALPRNSGVQTPTFASAAADEKEAHAPESRVASGSNCVMCSGHWPSSALMMPSAMSSLKQLSGALVLSTMSRPAHSPDASSSGGASAAATTAAKAAAIGLDPSSTTSAQA
mmetsp:Transcript_13066/g.42820  ORF Transcript_13066/g.42820 Transcript_13066/m.42820 type:complete len:364 (+) Transcript_13066:317-1408(+)|eukprot:scaffold9928_cov112-Isochrysis_galbana.AAC.8